MEIGLLIGGSIIAALITYCLYLKTQINDLDYRVNAIEHLIEMIEEEDSKNLD